MTAQTTVIPNSGEMGSLEVKHLYRYWAKQQAFKRKELKEIDFHEEANIDVILLSVLGLGIEQAIMQIYTTASFDEFENWVLSVNGGALNMEKITRFNDLVGLGCDIPLLSEDKVLSDDEMAFFHENGYIILRGAIPREDCEATIALICQYLDIDINDRASWYKPSAKRQGIMVQLFQHPLLQKNRDSPVIRKAYEQLWGRKDIWVNTDRVGFNPPETETFKFPGPRLHWDVSIELPIPFGLQGILYLSDTQSNQGAFSLIPGFQNRIESWVNSLPPGADPRCEDLYQLGVVPIAAKAGDFIIWHQALPHGSSPNTSTLPRIVQYINYLPLRHKILKNWK